jgi:hypothetical protein
MSIDSIRPDRAWLGVVSAEHTRRAVEHGFIQLNHGKRHNLALLRRGDGFVIYSPTDRYGEKTPLRAFTALGVIADEEPYLAEPMNMGSRGTIRPWRRRVDFLDVHPADLREVSGDLRLTRQPNWGYQLRRGLVPLDIADFDVLRDAMTRRGSGLDGDGAFQARLLGAGTDVGAGAFPAGQQEEGKRQELDTGAQDVGLAVTPGVGGPAENRLDHDATAGG